LTLQCLRGDLVQKLHFGDADIVHQCLDSSSRIDRGQDTVRCSFVGKIGGTVQVATVYSVGLHELPQKVREFMTKFPAAKIDLEYSRTTRVVRDVMNGTVELGVLAFPEPKRGLTITPMSDNRLVLIAPLDHKLASKTKVKVTDLNGQDFVHFERDVPTRKAMDKIFKANGVEVKKVAEFDNIETIKRAVEVGFGLAIVPEPAVSEAKKAGSLAVIQLAEKYWVRSVGVIHRSDKTLSLPAKKFLQLPEQPRTKEGPDRPPRCESAAIR